MTHDRILVSWGAAIVKMEEVNQELAACERPLSSTDALRISGLLQDALMLANQIKADIAAE